MRVAVLGQYPLDEERILGGVEAVMVPLLRALASFADLDLHIVTCQGVPADYVTSTRFGVPLHVRRRRRLGRLTFYARDVVSIRQALSTISPDIVHAHGVGIYAIAALGLPLSSHGGRGGVTGPQEPSPAARHASRGMRTPQRGYGIPKRSGYQHVVTMHGVFSREAQFAEGLPGRLRGSLDSFYEKYSVGRAQNLIAISPYVEEELARIGGFHGHLYAIENPVEDVFFTVPAENAASTDGGMSTGWTGATNGATWRSAESGAGGHAASTILYAGCVIPRKGLLSLLQALAQVRKIVPHATLRVAGEIDSDPAYVQSCRQAIAEYGLESAVAFLGSLTLEEMVTEYARCAVLALPSKQETAPVVVAEAMAAGRPVVTTRCCGMPYMVEQEGSGLLVDYGDAQGLAQALLRVLSDDRLRARMGQRGRELAQVRFRADVVARRTHDVYLEIMRDSR